MYQGQHLISNRQFKRGSELLLDALSTFTASELLSYNEFVALTVVAGALTLSRVDLKKKVLPILLFLVPDILTQSRSPVDQLPRSKSNVTRTPCTR